MDTGTKISGVAHLALIGAALFGGAFQSEPLPFELRDVSVVTSEEFAALLAAQRPPETATELTAPTQPEADADTADAPRIAETPEIDQAAPETTAAPDPGDVPERLPEPLPPQPDADANDTSPTLAPPEEDVALLPPTPEPPAPPRPVERVAPVAVAPPPPEASPDPVARPEVAPEEGTEAPKPEAEATAPPEATDQIVTEATETSDLAPTASPRPPARRPTPPTPTAAPAPDPDPTDAPTGTNAAIAAALNEALAGDATPAPAPTDPPLTQGERDDLIVAVGTCWNVGSLSSEALRTTVVVAVTMTEDAKPVSSTIRLISFSGGSESAAQQAFQAARRAILRCGGSGYDLPAEKYGQWREIEMTFNPEKMQNR